MNNDRQKYRVWDGKKKAYAHEGYVVTQLGLIGTYDPFVGLIRNINCTVEHCTGLSDKNGKLIYEGDVVKTKDFGKDIDNRINVNDYDTFVVKFHECGFCIENDSRRFYMTCRPKLEIIGNIHEKEQSK